MSLLLFKNRWLVAAAAALLFVGGSCGFVASPKKNVFVPRKNTVAVGGLFKDAILEFREPQTNVTVVLVGSMHYNPASIRLTSDTIDGLASQNKLGSVVIESCDVRYQESSLLDPWIKANVLNSEMGAAIEVGLRNERPVVLGDQRINVTVQRLGEGLKEIVTKPIKSTQETIKAFQETFPLQNEGKDEYLGPFSLLTPKLVLLTPVSFLKYPLSFFLKSPLVGSIVFGFLLLSNALDDSSSALAAVLMNGGDVVVTDYASTVQEYASALLVSGLETLIFSRLLLKELLMERNEVLAKSILKQCERYASSKNTKLPFWQFWKPPSQNNNDDESIMYVPGSQTKDYQINNSNNNDKVVVAVMGMAHCNGVKRLLVEQKV